MSTATPMLSFLLLVLAAASFSGALGASSSEHGTYVFDVFGDKVRFGDEYYIETSIENSTVLGVTVQEESCPHVLISETNFSLPIIFTRTPLIPTFVPVELGLNVQFINNTCNTSTTLLGINTNIPSIPWFVVIGGHDYNVFKIVKFNPHDDKNLYKLSYCPSNPLCACRCIDVGYHVDATGAIYLIPGDKELPIVFRPAKVTCKAEVV